MRVLGIDVSHWEAGIDWPTASRYLSFAYFKCTDGVSGIDPTFEANSIDCAQLGLPHAPYHYYQPGHDPIIQAEHFIQTAGKTYPRYIVDVEEHEGADDHLAGDLHAFLLKCTQLTGTKPAIYTSAGYWYDFVKPRPTWAHEYELIVAHYTAEHTPTLPVGWDTWKAWQFSDFFFVPGCICEVDADWFNGNLYECRQWFGNYRPVDPPTYSFKARSLFNQLHVRIAPSQLSREVDHLSKGEAVEIDQLGGQDVWVKHSRGWTCVEKAGYRYMEVEK